jgi:deazaflavin-dependent oxidoreductase (nitroreductase family)
VSDGEAEPQFLYLTTTGRKTGLPRQIEIWFVSDGGKFYILAEHSHRTQWVRNIQRIAQVRVRIGSRSSPEIEATARALDRERDGDAWRAVQRLSMEKYRWGDGLPVEITPGEAQPR